MRTASAALVTEHAAVVAARAILAENREPSIDEGTAFRSAHAGLHATDTVAAATLWALWLEIDRQTAVLRAATAAAASNAQWAAHEGRKAARIARWLAEPPLRRALHLAAHDEGISGPVRRGFQLLVEHLARDEAGGPRNEPPMHYE